MATTLYLLNTAPDTHLGTDNLNLRSSTLVPWTGRALGTSRGSGVATAGVSAITGPTPGVELAISSVPVEWISPPVAADITIAGTITLNLWGYEATMNDNAAINAVIEVIRANATATRNSNTLVEIARSTRVIELAVGATGVNNFTVTPTSTALNRGDRLRVRVFIDDVGTMAATGSTTFRYNGTTAAADGDSYVTFTENITFENPPGTAVLDQADTSGGGVAFGRTGSFNQQLAQPFAAAGSSLTEVRAYLGKVGAPTDDLILEIQTDSGGIPSGTVVGTVATVNMTTLTTGFVQYTYSTSISLTSAATYWLVFRRTGALNDSVCAQADGSTSTLPGGWTTAKSFRAGAWNDTSPAFAAGVRLAFTATPFTVYLTDTTSAVATASVDKEAWTSRGSGVTSIVTNTSTGWTAPVQATATAGGTVVDWFTRPLTAFTLTGMAVLNIRALESNAAANASLRCEIARVEGDGTSPTVWCSWCCAPTGTDNGELTTSEVARTINLSGDDLAISNGQRLRIRLYNEDSSGDAMVTGHTVTRYYAGTSGGASGDTYLTFPQTLTEYASGPYVYDKTGYGRESA